MSVEYHLNGVIINGRVDLIEGTDGFATAAERGVLGTGNIRIEDPDGTLVFNAWNWFTIDDTAATPTRVATYLIPDRNVTRGESERTTDARIYDCEIYDLNQLLHWRIPRDNDGKRPAETDVARVAWLLGSRALEGLVWDEGLVSASNPGSFLAADVRRNFADDILREILESAVKNAFVYWDASSGHPALFHDKDTATVWPSGFSISNVLSEVNDSTVFEPFFETSTNTQGNEIYGAVSYGWQGDPIFAESATINAAYFTQVSGFPDLAPRDAVYDTNRIGILATAEQASKDWLNARSGEVKTITVPLILPSSKVNLAYAGQEMDIKLTHVPGFESGATTRIRRRTVYPVGQHRTDPTQILWSVTLELWVFPTPADDATTEGECVPEASFAQLQGENRNGTGPDTYDFIWNNTGDDPDNKHDPAPLTGLLAYTDPVGTGATGIECLGTGDLTVTLLADVALVASGTYTAQFQVLKNGIVVLFEAHSTSGGLRFESWTTAPLVGVVSVVNGDELTARYVDSNPAGGIATFPAGVDATDLTVEGDLCDIDPADVPLPELGEPVGPESPTGDVDGVNTEFTTVGAWLPGTLRVLHDGIDQTAHILTSDPTAGTYELDYAPSVGSTLREFYESA